MEKKKIQGQETQEQNAEQEVVLEQPGDACSCCSTLFLRPVRCKIAAVQRVGL